MLRGFELELKAESFQRLENGLPIVPEGGRCVVARDWDLLRLMSAAMVRPRPGRPEPIADCVRRSSYGSWMSESASDSSSSNVDANRESRIADENKEGELAEVVENEALRVGTEEGSPARELVFRADESRGQMGGPPEGVRMDCSDGEARNPWLFEVLGGWLAARSRKLREVGVSVPLDARKRFVRSVSSETCFPCGDCIVE